MFSTVTAEICLFTSTITGYPFFFFTNVIYTCKISPQTQTVICPGVKQVEWPFKITNGAMITSLVLSSFILSNRV